MNRSQEEEPAEMERPGDDPTEKLMTEGAAAERKSSMRVMVAFDDSECSRYALAWALRNLLSSDSRLIIFSAQPLLEFSYVFATSSTYGPTLTASLPTQFSGFSLHDGMNAISSVISLASMCNSAMHVLFLFDGSSG